MEEDGGIILCGSEYSGRENNSIQDAAFEAYEDTIWTLRICVGILSRAWLEMLRGVNRERSCLEFVGLEAGSLLSNVRAREMVTDAALRLAEGKEARAMPALKGRAS